MSASSDFDPAQAARFAKLALDCIHKEYPNKIAHSMNSDADLKPPRQLTPAFYGCFDWHSSVHGHWMMVRLARLFPQAPFTAEARRAVAQSLTAANIAQEAKYLSEPGRSSFERPYGLAWLLQLATELREWQARANGPPTSGPSNKPRSRVSRPGYRTSNIPSARASTAIPRSRWA